MADVPSAPDRFKPSSSSLIYKQVTPPSAIEEAIWLDAAGAGSDMLLLSRGSSLELWSLRTLPGEDGAVSEDAASAEAPRLLCEAVYPLPLPPRSLAAMTLTGSAAMAVSGMPCVDVALASFDGYRAAVVAFDPYTRELRTVATLDYETPAGLSVRAELESKELQLENGAAAEGTMLPDDVPLPGSMLAGGIADTCVARVDAESSTTAMAVYSDRMVIIPVGGAEAARDALGLHAAKSQGSNAGLAGMPVAVNLRELDRSLGGVTVDFAWLAGYIEPTLAVLHVVKPVGPGRLDWTDHTAKLVVFSVDMSLGKPSLVWTAEELPHDVQCVVPAPAPWSGVVVLTPNAIIYVNHTRHMGVSLNGHARVTVSSARYKLDPLQADPGIALDCPRWAWISNTDLMVVTADGTMLSVSLVAPTGAVAVSGVRVGVIQRGNGCVGGALPPATCLAATRSRWLFAGSRVADAQLFALSAGAADSVGPDTALAASWQVRAVDSLRVSAAVSDAALGLAVAQDECYDAAPRAPWPHELLLATGDGPYAELAAVNATLRTKIVRSVQKLGVLGAWALGPVRATHAPQLLDSAAAMSAAGQDEYVLLSTRQSTELLAITDHGLEPVAAGRGTLPIARSVRTIWAGAIGGPEQRLAWSAADEKRARAGAAGPADMPSTRAASTLWLQVHTDGVLGFVDGERALHFSATGAPRKEYTLFEQHRSGPGNARRGSSMRWQFSAGLGLPAGTQLVRAAAHGQFLCLQATDGSVRVLRLGVAERHDDDADTASVHSDELPPLPTTKKRGRGRGRNRSRARDARAGRAQQVREAMRAKGLSGLAARVVAMPVRVPSAAWAWTADPVTAMTMYQDHDGALARALARHWQWHGRPAASEETLGKWSQMTREEAWDAGVMLEPAAAKSRGDDSVALREHAANEALQAARRAAAGTAEAVGAHGDENDVLLYSETGGAAGARWDAEQSRQLGVWQPVKASAQAGNSGTPKPANDAAEEDMDDSGAGSPKADPAGQQFEPDVEDEFLYERGTLPVAEDTEGPEQDEEHALDSALGAMADLYADAGMAESPAVAGQKRSRKAAQPDAASLGSPAALAPGSPDAAASETSAEPPTDFLFLARRSGLVQLVALPSGALVASWPGLPGGVHMTGSSLSPAACPALLGSVLGQAADSDVNWGKLEPLTEPAAAQLPLPAKPRAAEPQLFVADMHVVNFGVGPVLLLHSSSGEVMTYSLASARALQSTATVQELNPGADLGALPVRGDLMPRMRWVRVAQAASVAPPAQPPGSSVAMWKQLAPRSILDLGGVGGWHGAVVLSATPVALVCQRGMPVLVPLGVRDAGPQGTKLSLPQAAERMSALERQHVLAAAAGARPGTAMQNAYCLRGWCTYYSRTGPLGFAPLGTQLGCHVVNLPARGPNSVAVSGGSNGPGVVCRASVPAPVRKLAYLWRSSTCPSTRMLPAMEGSTAGAAAGAAASSRSVYAAWQAAGQPAEADAAAARGMELVREVRPLWAGIAVSERPRDGAEEAKAELLRDALIGTEYDQIDGQKEQHVEMSTGEHAEFGAQPPVPDPRHTVVLLRRRKDMLAGEQEVPVHMPQPHPLRAGKQWSAQEEQAAQQQVAEACAAAAESVIADDDPHSWVAVDRYALRRWERGLSVQEISLALTEGSKEEGIVLVGTGSVPPRGEDELCWSRLLVLRVAYVNREAQEQQADTEDKTAAPSSASGTMVPQLRFLTEVMLKQPPTVVLPLTVGGVTWVLLGAGAQVLVYAWRDGRLVKVGFHDIGVCVTSISVVHDVLVVGDVTRGVTLLRWLLCGPVMQVLASLPQPEPVLAVSGVRMGQSMCIIAADAESNVEICTYDPLAHTTWEADEQAIEQLAKDAAVDLADSSALHQLVTESTYPEFVPQAAGHILDVHHALRLSGPVRKFLPLALQPLTAAGGALRENQAGMGGKPALGAASLGVTADGEVFTLMPAHSMSLLSISNEEASSLDAEHTNTVGAALEELSVAVGSARPAIAGVQLHNARRAVPMLWSGWATKPTPVDGTSLWRLQNLNAAEGAAIASENTAISRSQWLATLRELDLALPALL